MIRHKNLIVEASRDHGKSWMFSFVWPLFNIQKCQDPKEPFNVALISYSEDQAKKNLARIRKAVENNQHLKWLRPKSTSYVWDSGMLNFSNECTLEAFGFGSSIRGGHYHLVVIDDPTKDHWTMSIEEQENFLYGVVVPAVRKNGQLVITGNPVDKKDLLARLETNKEFSHHKYPCIKEDGTTLWPEQYTLEDIEAKRRLIPAHKFAREYLLKRVSAADAKFKEEWIKYYREEEIRGRPLYRIMTIDPAISPGGDALAAVVTGTDSGQNTYVLDRSSFRGDFRAGVVGLCEMIERHRLDFVGIETFAFQRMYKIWLEEEMTRRGLQHVFIHEIGHDNRKSKAMRIEALQPKLAQGRLYFLEDHKPLIDQLLLWDPLGKHNEDDEIDALAWQVPVWQSPIEEGSEPHRMGDGTFEEAFEKMRSGGIGNYISKLFSDMGYS